MDYDDYDFEYMYRSLVRRLDEIAKDPNAHVYGAGEEARTRDPWFLEVTRFHVNRMMEIDYMKEIDEEGRG